MQPPAGSQVSRVPAQRPPSDHLAPPGPAPAPERPRRRVRTVLTVVAAVLTSLVLGGIVAGYVLYDRATAPDRSAPDVVVDNYLRAFLVDRNDTRANLYTCDGGGDLASLRTLREELAHARQSFGINISRELGRLAGWSDRATARCHAVDLISSASGRHLAERPEDWTVRCTRTREDWRVCAGRKVG